jgi:endonuclease/exonuclease/phosphatase family metal-dependent hydrolase
VAALAFVLAAFFAAVHFRTPGSIPSERARGTLRVVTYNVRAGLDGIDHVAEDLKALAGDVIALQEVERGVRRSKKVDQAQTLAEALGMHAEYAPSFAFQSGEHGVAILSRFRVSDVQTIRLPQGSGKWPRVALTARIEAPRPFRFVCVHLARPWGWPGSNLRARLDQIRFLVDQLKDEPLPIVIAGDFNSLPFSVEAATMLRHYATTWDPWRDGWATSFSLSSIGWPVGSIKIDHVYIDEHWKTRGTWVAPQGASDHRAVLADLVAVP